MEVGVIPSLRVYIVTIDANFFPQWVLGPRISRITRIIFSRGERVERGDLAAKRSRARVIELTY